MSSVIKQIEVNAGSTAIKYLLLGAVVIGVGYYVVGKVSDAVSNVGKSISDGIDHAETKIKDDAKSAIDAVSPSSLGADLSDWISSTWPSAAEQQFNASMQTAQGK